jgi:hypothetical protein
MKTREILDKILANKPKDPLEENPLEEHRIAEPELLPFPPQLSAIPISKPLEKEEPLVLDFMLDFKDELFTEYRNTSNYQLIRKP